MAQEIHPEDAQTALQDAISDMLHVCAGDDEAVREAVSDVWGSARARFEEEWNTKNPDLKRVVVNG
jgi:hypothetical protein